MNKQTNSQINSETGDGHLLPEVTQSELTQTKSLAMIHTRTVVGVRALPVVVEVHLANGLPAFSTVGLPETAVKESKERVRGAIINSGFEFPAKRITVNLSPADLPKTGSRFDLPIAIGILLASGQLPTTEALETEFIGELALDGKIRRVTGVLPSALAAGESNRTLILPTENANEASLAQSTHCLQASHILDVCRHLVNQQSLPACVGSETGPLQSSYPDIKDVKGQAQAKRALEIAASGEHSLIMVGPPGNRKKYVSHALSGNIAAPR